MSSTNEHTIQCMSCKTNVAGAKDVTRFPCPKCGKEIIRCGKCRRIVAQYQCTCGFLGPN
ncbi:MAG: zinc finger domain-containing protein [Candidatus Woesearchaeota archaeon]|nr:zinc finger domain-containing protein [Candidatus Woesearchaeota archaeon]